MYLEYYKKLFGDIPEFLVKYLEVPCLKRLKGIGFFCGMDYASKDVYDFRELITRYDHSLTVALLTYKLTNDKKATIAGLFHDVATPCFSHVIDYMNKDYSKQESTEEYTEEILRNDSLLLSLLKKDKIKVEEIFDFKRYSIVDCSRPMLCVDRIDGIILMGIGWSKNLTLDNIRDIVESLEVYTNDDNNLEVGFNDMNVCNFTLEVNDYLDELCHSNHDNYMMSLLSDIARLGIDNKLFTYKDLYKKTEDELFLILNSCDNVQIRNLLDKFYNIKIKDIPETKIPDVKKRVIKPLVLGVRIK